MYAIRSYYGSGIDLPHRFDLGQHPNFLEPWYGIGVVAGAFGVPYVWKEGQAPARITSYNVCYTKLLRLPHSKEDHMWCKVGNWGQMEYI